MEIKLPPQDLNAETSVLGGILLDNEAIDIVSEILVSEDFYRTAHTQIFSVMCDISERGEPVDLITLHAALKNNGLLDEVGGPAYISVLADNVPTAANIKYYADIVKEKSLRRKVINLGTDIESKGHSEESDVKDLVVFAEESLRGISDKMVGSDFCHVLNIIKDCFKSVEELYEKKSILTGITTGFSEIDYITSGFQPSDLIIIAGRPSMGKTAWCLNIAMNAVEIEGAEPVAIFSLEMSKEQLVMRLLSSEARVDTMMLQRGLLSESAWPKLTRAAGRIVEGALYIDDTPALSVLEIRAKARRLKADKGLGMVIIDYLQLMRGRDGMKNREQEISDISRSLKALAKELNVPVVALSQLSRAVEQRGGDKRPMLSDLRESGAIEQDADVVMFVYREEFYKKEDPDLKGIAEIIVAKQRRGPVGTVKLTWIAEYTRFENHESRNSDHWQDKS